MSARWSVSSFSYFLVWSRYVKRMLVIYLQVVSSLLQWFSIKVIYPTQQEIYIEEDIGLFSLDIPTEVVENLLPWSI